MIRSIITALAATLVLSACSSGKGSAGSGALSISAGSSASSAPSAGSPPSTAPSASPDPIALPSTIELTSLSVAVRELELEDGECAVSVAAPTAPPPAVVAQSVHGPESESGHPDAEHASSSTTGSHEHGEDGDHESSRGHCKGEVGPFVARLAEASLADLSAGKLPQLWTAKFPAGTYTELEAKLCAIDPATLKDPAQAALATAMKGATIVVEGTYQAVGAESPVSFSIPVVACAEIERHVNVTVSAEGAVSNLTLRLDVGAWFRDGQGRFIAPDSAAGVAAIARNIAASLDLYGDDDHDGRSDD